MIILFLATSMKLMEQFDNQIIRTGFHSLVLTLTMGMTPLHWFQHVNFGNICTDAHLSAGPVRVAATFGLKRLFLRNLLNFFLNPYLCVSTFCYVLPLTSLIFFVVSTRSCPECQGLWPPLDCEGVGLIYGPLWNCLGDDTPDGTALPAPVLWRIQVHS